MASSLPLEIWFAIVDYLPRNDQLHVAQVSAQFCAVARKIVYRNVNLRSDDDAVDATLVLLARDRSVSRNVKRLHIYTTARTAWGPTWFDPNVLAGMTNLCGLNLTGMPFHTAEDQHNFDNAVSKSLPALKKLEYRSLQPENSYTCAYPEDSNAYSEDSNAYAYSEDGDAYAYPEDSHAYSEDSNAYAYSEDGDAYAYPEDSHAYSEDSNAYAYSEDGDAYAYPEYSDAYPEYSDTYPEDSGAYSEDGDAYAYSEASDTYKPNPRTHVPVLQISGLQEITWIDPDTFVHPSPILSPIHASRETLTHIRIPEYTRYAASYEPLTQLFTLRFPCLSTLHLGGWSTTTPVGGALTRFLIAHPLIEDLHLNILNPYQDGRHCHVVPDDALGPGTLPNLRRLTADTFNLTIFLRSGISSLQTLESLRTGIRYIEEEEEDAGFAEMFRALKAYGGLPGLKALDLDLDLDGYAYREAPRNARWIMGFAELCPKVEQLWTNCFVEWTAVTNQDIFASYCNLKTQTMPGMHLYRLSKQDRLNYVKDLVALNPSVTELLFYSPRDDDVIIFQFRVVRDAEGGITTIVEVLENGDY